MRPSILKTLGMGIGLLVSSQIALAGGSGKFTVCMANLNSMDESQLFQQYLNPNDFEFVELTQMGSPGHHWFDAACASGIQCDIFMISGHFTGQFSGSNGRSLPLETMERHQCDHSCDGILKNPVETFLFGCNVLATKDIDHRNKEIYLEVLRTHTRFLKRLTREKTVEARYGEFGENFRQRTRFALSGTSHIYGFWSVDPTGDQIKPYLQNYFTSRGDYTQWITQQKLQKVSDYNGVLSNAFFDLNYIECKSMNPTSPEFSDRKRICELLDRSSPVKDRLKMITGMAATQSFNHFLPNIETFFNENPPMYYGPEELTELANLKNQAYGKQALESAINSTQGNSLRLSLIELGAKIGWFDETQRVNMRYEVLKRSLRTLASTPSGGDENILCDMPWDGKETAMLKASDIDPSILADPVKSATLGCVQYTSSSLPTPTATSSPTSTQY